MLRISHAVFRDFFGSIAARAVPDANSVPELEEMGRRRLEMGIPLEAMLHVYRIAGRDVFNAIAAEIRPGEELSLREIGTRWVDYIDRCSTRASSGYIEASNERVRRIEARRGAVLQALIAANDQAEVAAVASEFSLTIAGAYAPILVAADQGRLDDLVAAAPPNSLAGFRGSALLLLAPDAVPDLGAIRRRFADDGSDVLAVWGEAVAPGAPLRAEIEHAERVMTSAIAQGVVGAVGPDDLLAHQLALADRRNTATLVRIRERLRAKDPGGLIESTLETFLKTGSVPETAKGAVVHPNTVAYRLRRVAELTGYDPRVPSQAAILVLALAARDVSA